MEWKADLTINLYALTGFTVQGFTTNYNSQSADSNRIAVTFAGGGHVCAGPSLRYSYLFIHLIIGFTVAYLFTESLALASGIALVEPVANAVAFFFHERAWNQALNLN